MKKRRYLTKSRFKLATECPTKLFYTQKKDEYANQSLEDTFLLSLADGGFQVGHLAQCYFPNGHDIKAQDYDEALTETNKLLERDKVTIYEAAIATEKLFIRVDVLVKTGNRLELYEVKAKSIDPNAEAPFLNKKGTIKSDWRPHLYDVAFQKHVIEQALPQYNVFTHLMVADKSAICPTDGLNQKFRLVKDKMRRRSVEVSETLTPVDLSPPILCSINVDALCDQIYAGTAEVRDKALSFTEQVELFANSYASDTKIVTPISSKCSSCEFYINEDDAASGLRSGKSECWKANLGWKNEDLLAPTVLDVWNFRRKDKLIKGGCIKMADLTREDVSPKTDGKPGLSVSQRQWLQVEKFQKNDTSMWLDRVSLQREMNSWKFPLHFIDFETTTTALPFNAGRRPYELIAFQFSHHIINKDGLVEHFGEYLNTERGIFPNYDFVRALKEQLENDNGSIFRYSHHENTVLNTIYRQLREEQKAIPDREDLCTFIKSITHSVKESAEKWIGERNMVDMWDIVKRFYYAPATKGSNSIKDVLPAILHDSAFLRNKYSKPIYGAVTEIPSHNFTDWQWIESKDSKDCDPYKMLPKLFQDISDKDMKILTEEEELRDGGAALTAYARMQFEEMTDYERGELREALLKYCELDTLAMAMIYEGWRSFLLEESAVDYEDGNSLRR